MLDAVDLGERAPAGLAGVDDAATWLSVLTSVSSLLAPQSAVVERID